MKTNLSWTLATVGVSAALGTAFGCGRSGDDAAKADVASGEAQYAALCAGCHGTQGEGKTAPTLRHWTRGEKALAGIIDERMPLGDPAKCTGKCATDVAKYILEKLQGDLVCAAPRPTARGVRLLTRREYRRTVQDLLGLAFATKGGDTCEASFRYDPQGRSVSKVHVAGSFNAWPATTAAGGWPLTLTGAVWTGKRTLPQGQYLYKFVLDERDWIADPGNTKTSPDGFGGSNSVLDVQCGVGGGAADPTTSFPVDTRPEGFLFDDSARGRIVTPVLADEYFRAATTLATVAVGDLGKITGCANLGDEKACTASFVARFGARAFRRPLTGAETARYVDLASKQGSLTSGVRAALRAFLNAPQFLYRSEQGTLQKDGTYRLSGFEIASALSYGLWGTMPDDVLFAAAEKGELDAPEGREKHARRMLADARARETVGTFAEQWLGSENVASATKAAQLYPAWSEALGASMAEETRRFVTSVVFDGSHTFEELVTAKYSMVDDRLAPLYGLAGGSASFEKRDYPDGTRAGILGHASVLTATSHSDQTSPIRRGLFVRRRLLCQELPAPPPNAGGVPKVDPNATTRERFAQHTANPTCKACHQYIDGVGFGFEPFDAIGQKRAQENGRDIDPKGDMNDVEGLGTQTHAPYTGLRELGQILASSRAAKACVVKQYGRFVAGGIDDDACASSDVVRRFEATGGDLREMIVATFASPSFVLRRSAP